MPGGGAARHSFDVPLDWRLPNGFRQIVLRHLPEIGYGHTASYAMMARLAGRPRAVRAVGTACATNPLPVVVPAIAWCVPTAGWAAISVGSGPSEPCSPWKREHEPLP